MSRRERRGTLSLFGRSAWAQRRDAQAINLLSRAAVSDGSTAMRWRAERWRHQCQP